MADAEDILQEVVLRIHRHGHELDHVEQVSGWVYRIAANAIIDHYRRPARREQPAGVNIDRDQPTLLTHALDHGERSDPREELAGCPRPMIDRLPGKYREAITLTELDGVTQAGRTGSGCRSRATKTRVRRARRQLKELLLDCCQV